MTKPRLILGSGYSSRAHSSMMLPKHSEGPWRHLTPSLAVGLTGFVSELVILAGGNGHLRSNVCETEINLIVDSLHSRENQLSQRVSRVRTFANDVGFERNEFFGLWLRNGSRLLFFGGSESVAI